jgi:hypothetical protein
MLDQEVVEKLKERYPQIHPLLFNRSVERARSVGELFDILESIPNEYPIVWGESEHRWVFTNDILQKEGLKE